MVMDVQPNVGHAHLNWLDYFHFDIHHRPTTAFDTQRIHFDIHFVALIVDFVHILF